MRNIRHGESKRLQVCILQCPSSLIYWVTFYLNEFHTRGSNGPVQLFTLPRSDQPTCKHKLEPAVYSWLTAASGNIICSQ